jgi:predicted patatin/cPLA2 family phospholipase
LKANISSFIAGQKKRNYAFYTEYSQRDEYMSRRNISKKGCYLDVSYIYGTLSNSGGENPLDFKALCESPTEFIAVATDAIGGEVKYFTKADMRPDYYNVLMSSSAIPYVCRPQEVDGTLYYDGALSDPVPIEKAFAMGCGRVVLVLTNPVDYLKDKDEDIRLAERIRDRYPLSAEALISRAEKYNASVDLAKQLEHEGKVRIIAPFDTCGVDTLTKDVKALDALYRIGYEDGADIKKFLIG